ncbi:hypothetical protein ACHRV1_16695 [Flavobacterium aquidurense]|jgi:hypothetical protein|uniref:hypothetical protein n=1 Tax=Flavobacterium aquidurense TaxID=362413 RepID=UPI0009114CED|nr:hypothetical protein [Flavobacterium aquidurense]SHG87336.1 hypothetical protein SAMN05444481_108155 [Flavobacterium frigidimaris]
MEESVIEKSVFEEIPTEKIYSEKAIRLGTFLGGPLVAGYFMAENFKVFGDFNKVRNTWIITILSTLIIFGLIFMIPEDVKIPNVIFPLIYMGIAAYLTKTYQEKNILQHTQNGGEFFSGWRIAGISIIGCIVTLGAIFGVAFFNEAANGRLTESTKTYGALNHEIVYQNNINENEVDKIAKAFEKETFFDNSFTKYIYLEKIDNNYEISISCNESISYDPIAYSSFVELRKNMQKDFPDNKIIFKLVVNDLENVVKRIE